MRLFHYVFLIFIALESIAFAAGDVDNNGTVDLTDAVLSLQVCAGMTQNTVNTSEDVNADGKIGLEEAIYVLHKVSTPDTVYYYVDFDSGSDNNSGTSAGDAWKHAPGDANATGNPASVSLQGGDVVLFRADVVYKGSITIQAGGTEGNPITYLGQGWGEGKAIIDGSEALAGTWTETVKVIVSPGKTEPVLTGSTVVDQPRLVEALRSKVSERLPELVRVWAKTTRLSGMAVIVWGGMMATDRTVEIATVLVNVSEILPSA